MKYSINHSTNKTAYMQLYEQLRKDIVEGVFSYGTKLPSKRLLAEESDVSVITVEHAYSILCDEGYVEARQRSGYFVIYKESDFLSNADGSYTETVHSTTALSADSQFPFSVLSKTMRKVLLDYGENILVKSPNHGCMELRGAISTYLARSNGINVSPQQIVIGSGAEYLYSLIVQLLGKNRIFALENPSYEQILNVYRANGVECDMLNMGRDGIQSEELERTEASVLHITPFNSFPSGITARASKRYEYINWAEKRNGYIIEDNYDSELTVSTKAEDTVFSLAKNNKVIYINTFSRTIAPSFRVGYMVLPKQLAEEFENKLGFYSCTVPVFEQYVLAELINNGDFERNINRIRRQRRKQKP
ncbi:MAG: PLP-dependent aminotransferase family protein [Oscillospiraceae bacterium]|nr:PLP-dependent aminotransferase family protein [Oscillospiraceae bacterium]